VIAGSIPLRLSFAPNSNNIASGFAPSAQSILDKPPADVSPETPAFITFNRVPASLKTASNWSTNPSFLGNPYPAIKLSPKASNLSSRSWLVTVIRKLPTMKRQKIRNLWKFFLNI
jgi:hypothetical protein